MLEQQGPKEVKIEYDENGNLQFSERYTLEENGNYRTETYMPTSDGTDTYLYMVIVQER